MICSNCGRILSEREEQSSKEWRLYDIGLQTRAGVPRTLARHDLGLSTIIGSANIDASGNKLDPAMRSMMNRLATWDIRSQKRAFHQLDALRYKLGLSDSIVEKTAYIYRRVSGLRKKVIALKSGSKNL